MKPAALSIPILCLFLATGAFAAEQSSPPPAAITATIEVNAGDIAVLQTALHIAAQSCDTNSIGCQVGQYKDAELAKLSAAMTAIQAKTKPAK